MRLDVEEEKHETLILQSHRVFYPEDGDISICGTLINVY
jgi:hypothetical protein